MFLEFGVRPGQGQAQAFAEGLRLVEAGEAWGADAAWLSEFHFTGERSVLSSPIAIAGALAARTSRIRIGTAVYVLPLTHPLRIAEEVATLDCLSDGRIDLGVGRSGFTNFYRGYGIDYGESQARFDEALSVLRQAWSGRSVEHNGTFYNCRSDPVVPQPIQKPHPPLRMAATRPDTFEKVAREGLPIFVGLRGDDLDALAANLMAYRATWRAAGHPGRGSVFLRIPVFSAASQAAALDRPRDGITYYFQRQSKMVAQDTATRSGGGDEVRSRMAAQLAELKYDDILHHRVAFGSPTQLIERFQQLNEVLGIDGIVGEMNAGGALSEDDVLRSLRLICDEVMPAFR